MKYVHYGASKYDPNKFNKIINNDWPWIKPKPGTGLWASPVNSEYGWRQWCKAEEFNLPSLDKSFKFTLVQDARIFTINDEDDLKILRKLNLAGIRTDCVRFYLDFEAISKVYDVIYLTDQGQRNTRFNYPYSLYGWDCECILVLNKEVIKI